MWKAIKLWKEDNIPVGGGKKKEKLSVGPFNSAWVNLIKGKHTWICSRLLNEMEKKCCSFCNKLFLFTSKAGAWHCDINTVLVPHEPPAALPNGNGILYILGIFPLPLGTQGQESGYGRVEGMPVVLEFLQVFKKQRILLRGTSAFVICRLC